MFEEILIDELPENEIKDSEIVAVMNFKGGCGKSSTCDALANYIFNEKNKRVLLIDNDPQTNVTQRLGISNSEIESYPERSSSQMYLNFRNSNVIRTNKKLPICLKYNKENNTYFGIIIGNVNSEIDANSLFVANQFNDTVLNNFKELLNFYKRYFHYIIIDTPPAIENSHSNMNLLKITNNIIIPIDNFEAIHGFKILLDKLKYRIKDDIPNVVFTLTRYNKKDIVMLKKQVVEKIKENNDNCFKFSEKELIELNSYNTNTLQFIMEKLFEESVCKNIVTEISTFRNFTYSGIKNSNLRKRYDDQSEEILNKIKNNDGKFILSYWKNLSYKTKLDKYLEIISTCRTNQTKIDFNDFVFENSTN